MKMKLIFGLLFFFLLSCKKDDPKPLGNFSYKGTKISLISGTISKAGTQASGFDLYYIFLSKDESTFIELDLYAGPGDWIEPGTYIEGSAEKAFELNNGSSIALNLRIVNGAFQGARYSIMPQGGSITLSMDGNIYTITGSMNCANDFKFGDAGTFTFSFSGPLTIVK